MGFRPRKSINVGPLRINLSKSGVGYSVGGKGFRVTRRADGGVQSTASIPGTGISYTQTHSSKGSGRRTASATPATEPEKPRRQVPEDPYARPDPPRRKKPKKPIYARTWFIALCIIFFLGILGAGSQGRSVRQAQEDEQREQHQTVEDEAAPEDPEAAQDTAEAPESVQEPPEVQDPAPAQETPASAPVVPAETASEPDPEPEAAPQPDPEPAASPQPEPEAAPEPQPDPEPATNERTVYVTATGSKYHYDGNCGNGTYIPSTLEKAEASGLTPCAKCAGG